MTHQLTDNHMTSNNDYIFMHELNLYILLFYQEQSLKSMEKYMFKGRFSQIILSLECYYTGLPVLGRRVYRTLEYFINTVVHA